MVVVDYRFNCYPRETIRSLEIKLGGRKTNTKGGEKCLKNLKNLR